MQPILQAISGDICIKLDEITALIIAAEAGDEFPQHLVQKIITLPADKRKMLLDVVGAWVDNNRVIQPLWNQGMQLVFTTRYQGNLL
jgi:hypothetical protein